MLYYQGSLFFVVIVCVYIYMFDIFLFVNVLNRLAPVSFPEKGQWLFAGNCYLIDMLFRLAFSF